jgi:hypothetical protein
VGLKIKMVNDVLRMRCFLVKTCKYGEALGLFKQ